MPEVYVKFNSLEEAMSALQGNLGASVPHAAPVPAAPAYTPAPQPQAPAPQYAPAAPAAPAAPPMPVAPTPAADAGISSAQLAAQAQAYAKVHGAKAVKAIFAEFGANGVAQIKPEYYAAAMQRMAV